MHGLLVEENDDVIPLKGQVSREKRHHASVVELVKLVRNVLVDVDFFSVFPQELNHQLQGLDKVVLGWLPIFWNVLYN